MAAEIVWVQDEFNGPMNGMCIYENKKCWFSRMSFEGTEESEYEIYKLDEDVIENIEREHKEYCETTGSPLLHGDPHIITRNKFMRKGEEEVGKVEKRSLLEVKKYEYKINPMSVCGEKVGTIKQKCFVNYFLPRRVEIK